MFEAGWKIAKSKTDSKKNPSKGSQAQDRQQRIARKAYELFERRGYSHGNDLGDWFEAERIVKSGRV